jgi:hypothetical protein
MTSEDIDYLFAQGALSLPSNRVRDALFHSYLEYVHPYLPLLETQQLLEIVQDGSGAAGRISLLLLQAIILTGAAFVDMEYLRSAGFTSRMLARKSFFHKTRVRV